MRLHSTLAAATALMMAAASPASAFDRTDYEAAEGNFVTAQSEFGNGAVSGPVRHLPQGRQVQLPGGTWVWCEKSCAESLRLATVDFWEHQNGLTSGPGLFGKLQLGW